MLWLPFVRVGKQNRDACFLHGWETCGRVGNGSYRSPNPQHVPEVTTPPSRAAAVPAFWCIQRLLRKAYRALSASMDILAWLFLMAKKNNAAVFTVNFFKIGGVSSRKRKHLFFLWICYNFQIDISPQYVQTNPTQYTSFRPMQKRMKKLKL